MPSLKHKSGNVFFDTLGCAKNICDTEEMQKILISDGYNVVDTADDADIIVLNTCAFIKIASQESIDTFFQYRNYYKDKKIIVCGCLVSRYSDSLISELTEADAFVSCKEEHNISECVEKLIECEREPAQKIYEAKKSFAYVKISDGCNRFCSYCTIPFIRGRYKSVEYCSIKEDVAAQINLGAKEIVLVAQDCGSWGKDLDNDLNLSTLLKYLSNDFKDIKFRVLYIQPDAINDELIETFASTENIVNYFDIPIQHVNSKIISAMNRSGDYFSYLSLFNKIRQNIKDCVIRTSIIVGFPGETDEFFDELCDFINEAKLDYVGCFEFSMEDGTKAASFKQQIDDNTKLNRANTIREIADDISLNKLEKRIGEIHTILIEGCDEGRFFGRAWFQAPEVDGYVYISEFDDCTKIKIGSLVDVKILDCEAYDLVGKICK